MAGFSILQEAQIPFNGSGTFVLAEAAFVPGTPISSSAMNSDLSDIATGISTCVTKDGQTIITQPIRFASGSVGLPGIAFVADPDCGFYRIGTNNIGVSAGGSKILDIATTGLGVTGVFSATGLSTLAAITASGLLTLSGTSHMLLNNGTTGQRPAATAAAFRYNSTITLPEFSDGVSFESLSGAQPVAAGFKNLVIVNNAGTPNTQIDVDADIVTIQTAAGRVYSIRSVNLTINAATTGANGLDAGSLANNTWYAVFVIYNPTTGTTAGLASTSATSPTLPSGYTVFSRFGWMRTGGSATFLRTLQYGRDAQYTSPPLPLIASGTSGTFSATTPTFGTASITGFFPTTASKVFIVVQNLYNNVSTTNVYVAPNTSYAGYASVNPPPIYLNSAQAATGQVSMILEATTVAWVSSAGGGALFAQGWTDNI